MLRRGEEYGPPRQRLHERGRGEPIEFGERSPAATNNRPPIGAVLNAMVTSIKPNHGVFTSLPLADGTAIQGLIHLSEVRACARTLPLSTSEHPSCAINRCLLAP